MLVVIPSRGRAGKMRVMEKMPRTQLVVVVVPKDEQQDYERAYRKLGTSNVHVVGLAYNNIGDKRQWILDAYGSTPLVMLDDDLRFRVREDGKHFRAAETEDVAAMLKKIEHLLTDYVHVSIADEFMCQHNPPGLKVGGRYNQVLAYNFANLTNPKQKRPRFRLAINEEHDVNIQLCQMGHRPRILTDYTKGSKYNAVGGCSTWRTPEFELEQFEEFARLWPDVVTIRNGGSNLCGKTVRVNWRRACR